MTLVLAFMHLYNFFFFIASVHSFFQLFKYRVLINRWNGPQYQRVLALCAFFFFTGAIPKGLILRKFCVYFVSCKFASGLTLCFFEKLWFDDLCAE